MRGSRGSKGRGDVPTAFNDKYICAADSYCVRAKGRAFCRISWRKEITMRSSKRSDRTVTSCTANVERSGFSGTYTTFGPRLSSIVPGSPLRGRS